MSRRADDYPKAFENSLDAQAIERMIQGFKMNTRGLALAQARETVEMLLGALKRGEWLDERDGMVRALTGKSVGGVHTLDITPERAQALLESILHTHPQLRSAVVPVDPPAGTFHRTVVHSDVCRNCSRPEGEHIWQCKDCNKRMEADEKGLPKDLHGHSGGTLYCPLDESPTPALPPEESAT